MDNVYVQISRHGDVVLTDGLSDDELEKAGCMPSHKMAKADMVTKDKYCMEKFGKYSECSEMQKAQCDKVHGKMEKAEPGFKTEKMGHQPRILYKVPKIWTDQKRLLYYQRAHH